LRSTEPKGELSAHQTRDQDRSAMFSKSNSGAVTSKKMVIVTTSWDDGHCNDLKVAELLDLRKLPGTFYVTSGGLGKSSNMPATDLRELSKAGFEIGGHTVTHPILTDLDPSSLNREVVECKASLEAILSREVSSFAYPKGRFNANVVAQVKKAGFRCARGVRMLSFASDFPPFDMPVTIQAYPHRWTHYCRNLLRRGEAMALARSSILIGRSTNWVQLGKALFDRALREGGAWHLLGHSWEMDTVNAWSELKKMLDYVSGREGVRYLTNGDLGLACCSKTLPEG
jgi:peptidoglycan-N-acetylglucosamine deacetylase